MQRAGQSVDTMPELQTVRATSFDRMFSPGAAAIASRAAYSDGPGSVVFRPPTVNPTLGLR